MITLNLDNQGPHSKDVMPVIADEVRCVVKWFRQEDGYGFLQSDSINSDIFIHSSKLGTVTTSVTPGDMLVCKVVRGFRGPQVDEVYHHSPITSDEEPEYSEGFVKWFNVKSDFGFVKNIDHSGKDIFLSGKKVRSLGIDVQDLKPNKPVLFTAKVDQRGNKVVDRITVVPKVSVKSNV